MPWSDWQDGFDSSGHYAVLDTSGTSGGTSTGTKKEGSGAASEAGTAPVTTHSLDTLAQTAAANAAAATPAADDTTSAGFGLSLFTNGQVDAPFPPGISHIDWSTGVFLKQLATLFTADTTPDTPPPPAGPYGVNPDTGSWYEYETPDAAVEWQDKNSATVFAGAFSFPFADYFVETGGSAVFPTSFNEDVDLYAISDDAFDQPAPGEWPDLSSYVPIATWTVTTTFDGTIVGMFEHADVSAPATVDLPLSSLGIAAPRLVLITRPKAARTGTVDAIDLPQIPQDHEHSQSHNDLFYNWLSAIEAVWSFTSNYFGYVKHMPRWRYWIPEPAWYTGGGHFAQTGGGQLFIQTPGVGPVPVLDGLP